MKKNILCLSVIILGLISASFHPFQKDYSLARVSKINNKLVFLWSEPTTDYEIAFTFKNGIPNYDCLSPEGISIRSIENANMEAVNQGKLYDAIITQDGSSRDLAIIWTDKTKDNDIARVKKNEGKLVFVQCEPLADYEIVDKCVLDRSGSCPTHQQKIDKLVKKATNKKNDADAVIYGSTKYDFVIKFK